MWYSPAVVFLNLTYCRVQYNSIQQRTSKIIILSPSILFLVWSRPKNLFNRTGYPGLSQAAGGKTSGLPDVLESLFTNNREMLSHIVNITLQSVSITRSKLTTVCITVTVLKYRRLHFSCMPLILFKSTNVHITVCGILIEKDWILFTVTRLLVV